MDSMPFASLKTVAVLLLGALAMACGSSSDDDYADRMAAEHQGDTPVASGAATSPPAAPVETADVVYATVDERPVTGYLARPAGGAEGLPGIIVIQEWWGLNDNIRAMTRRLAGEGYVALAVDLYEGQVASDPETARELVSKSMGREPSLDENLRQAYRFLSEEQGAPRVGVIGWCFGGGWSLRTALLLPVSIDAVVIYYGRLVTDPAQLATIQAPVLGLFGAEDQGIPVATVREFEAAMKKLGKDVTVRIYDGANHAFANPSGTRYNPEAAEDAWTRTLAFFDAHLHTTGS